MRGNFACFGELPVSVPYLKSLALFPSKFISTNFDKILFRQMKQVLIIYAVLIVAIAGWWIITTNDLFKRKDPEQKQQALKVSKPSDELNHSISTSLDSYFDVSSAFTNNDTAVVNKNAKDLLGNLNDLNLEELKKDTFGIYETAVSKLEDTKGSLQQMIDDGGLDAKRKTFTTVSDNVYTFLNAIRYDGARLYWMECQSAFGENSPGYWLSRTEKPENPYGQKDCGTVKKKMNVPK